MNHCFIYCRRTLPWHFYYDKKITNNFINNIVEVFKIKVAKNFFLGRKLHLTSFFY